MRRTASEGAPSLMPAYWATGDRCAVAAAFTSRSPRVTAKSPGRCRAWVRARRSYGIRWPGPASSPRGAPPDGTWTPNRRGSPRGTRTWLARGRRLRRRRRRGRGDTRRRGRDLSGDILIDGSSTVGPAHLGRRRGVQRRELRREHHRRHIGHGRRLRALLQGRDRHLGRLAARSRTRRPPPARRAGSPTRSCGWPRTASPWSPAALDVGRRQPHHRSAEGDLVARLEDQELEGHPARAAASPTCP